MCSSKISGAIRLKGKQDDHNQDHFDTSHLHDDLKALSVRGGMVTGLAQVSRLLIGLGAIAVLARLLTPGDFGLIVMVLPLSGFLSLFSDAGLSAATV